MVISVVKHFGTVLQRRSYDAIVFYIYKNISEIALFFFYSHLLLGVKLVEKR